MKVQEGGSSEGGTNGNGAWEGQREKPGANFSNFATV